MDRKSVEVFCFVAGAMILVLNGRDVEAGVGRNVRENGIESSEDTYPFINGVLTSRPMIDTTDLEERDTDGYPFINGLRNIPRHFGIPDNLDEAVVGNYGEFPFRDGLRRNTEAPGIESIFGDGAKVGNDGDFPFVDGLRRRRPKPTSRPESETKPIVEDLKSEAVLGSNGQFPFKDGLRRNPDGRRKPQSIFDDGAKLGSDNAVPFVNGLRRHISTTENPESTPEPEVEDFQKTNEEYPFINGLRRHRRSISKSETSGNPPKVENLPNLVDDIPLIDRIRLCASGNFFPFVDCYHINRNRSEQIQETQSDDEYPFINGILDNSDEYPFLDKIIGKDSHPIKKRSVGGDADRISDVNNQTTQPGANPSTEVVIPPTGVTIGHENVSSASTEAPVETITVHRRPPLKPLRLREYFGERKPNDTELMSWSFKKPIDFGHSIIVTDVVFPQKIGKNGKVCKYGKNYKNCKYAKNDCIINHIMVQNAGYPFGQLRDDAIAFIEGGIGSKNVTITITSLNTYLYGYRVFIYGMCP